MALAGVLALGAGVGFFGPAGPAPLRAEGTFIAGAEDVPLPEGVRQDADAGLAYDTPAGRIVDAYLLSDSRSGAEILGFYDRTLPQLGWRIENGRFVREDEVLTVEVLDDAPPSSVHLRLIAP